jgi:hypothetical protein
MIFIICILGYILGYYLMLAWIYRNQHFHGPDSNIIRKCIYYQDGKYYRFSPEICICIE